LNDEPWRVVASEGDTRVVEVTAHGHVVRYLLSARGVLGAAFVAEELRDQPLFTVFALHRSVRFLAPRPRNALVLGLGANAVPGHLRAHGVATDVVERDAGVCALAARFFGADDPSPASEGTSTRGRLWMTDAEEFLFAGGERQDAKRYDVVIHDLFSARNPSAMLRQAVFRRLRDAWLEKAGVLIVNFLGHHDPKASKEAARGYPLGAAIARSLRRVFAVVRCFREVPLDMDEGLVANIMCWASSQPWTYHPPTTGEFAHAPKMSPQWATVNYQQWEVFEEVQPRPSPDRCDELEPLADAEAPCASAREAVVEAHAVIAEAMWKKTSQELLPYPGLWAAAEHCSVGDAALACTAPEPRS